MDKYTENDLLDLDIKYGHSLVKDEDALELIKTVRHYRDTFNGRFQEFGRDLAKLVKKFHDRVEELEAEVDKDDDAGVTCEDLKKLQVEMFELMRGMGIEQHV